MGPGHEDFLKPPDDSKLITRAENPAIAWCGVPSSHTLILNIVSWVDDWSLRRNEYQFERSIIGKI